MNWLKIFKKVKKRKKSDIKIVKIRPRNVQIKVLSIRKYQPSIQ